MSGTSFPGLFPGKGKSPGNEVAMSAGSSSFPPITSRGFTLAIYHLREKTGWSTVVVNGTRRILNGNFHGDALVPFPKRLLESSIKGNRSQKVWK